MRRVLAIARREWRDQWRQPWMLGAMAGVPLVTGLVVLGLLGLVAYLGADPDRMGLFASNLKYIRMDPGDVMGDSVGTLVGVWDFLLLSQLMGMTAVLAGHSVIGDRECGALPFLLLAPLRPGELLLGKVLGALGAPLAITAVVGVPLTVAMALVPGTEASAPMLALHPSWWVGLFGAGTAWAAVVACLAATLSGLATDVRTAQQAAWLLVFVVNLVGCGLITLGMAGGWGVGLVLCLVGLLPLGPALFLGGRIVHAAAVR